MKIEREELVNVLKMMPGNNMAYFLKDDKLEEIYCDDNILNLTGYQYTNNFNFVDLIFIEDRDVITKKIIENIKNKNYVTEYLFRLDNIDKGFIWVHMNTKRAEIEDDEVVITASIVDVTKEMNNSFAIIEASDLSICVIEKKSKRFLYANSLFYNLIDSTEKESMGKHCYELLCKVMEMKNNNNCLCYSCINSPKPIEYYNEEKQMHISMHGKEITWGEYEAYVFYLKDITESKIKDETIEDTQKRFNVALENSDLMIWEYDIVNSRCINSEKAGRDYNIPLIIENYPESLYETGHLTDATIKQIKECKQRLLNGETGFSVERETIDKYGKSNWQKVDYSLECDASGKPIRAIVCGLDITEKKEIEKKYQEQLEYRDKLASSALYSVNADLNSDEILEYTTDNKHIEDKYKNIKSVNKLLEVFTDNIDIETKEYKILKGINAKELIERFTLGQNKIEFYCDDTSLNKNLKVDIHLYKNISNNHIEALLIVNDITENALLQKTFKHVALKDYDFILVINCDDGNIFLWAEKDYIKTDLVQNYDEAIKKMSKQYKDSYYSEEDYNLMSKGMMLSEIKKRLEETEIYEFNIKASYDGLLNTFRLSFSYADENKQYIIFSRTNITNSVLEEQNRQEELEKALKNAKEADRAKTDFLSRMSHDMRTPMNGIIGMTTLSLDEPGLTKQLDRNLNAIMNSSMYLLQLINDTLDMNKIESNKLTLKEEAVDVEKLIQNIINGVKPLADAKNISLEFVPINAELEYIYIDRTRVQQIFLNILSNAVKFTNEDGHIKMIVECLKRENDIAYDRIVVEDTGCGMSKEFLEHIFEPFTQESNRISTVVEGTGLGMSIVKNLVELMGGKIEIESEIGVGTKVIVYLNFQRVFDVKPEINNNHIDDNKLKGKRILLVEDHDLNAVIATKLLEKKEMIVERAVDGKKAVELFKGSDVNYYDLVLMDIRMPGMNGLEATKVIRSLDRTDSKIIPIIAMTANAYDEDKDASIKAGMNAHLAKPIEPEKLYKEISKYL